MTGAASDEPSPRAAPADVSLYHLLRYTPMRDAVHGRLTARLDIRGRIAAAGFPQPIQSLVMDVARRTRLWRLEKADVVDELIAHFLDGLDAGRPAEQLIERFGDPARAAKLIRRAKKRQRPWIWRAWVRTWQALGLFVLALLLIYAVAAIQFFSGSPSPSRDYLAELNATALAAREEDRAWPLYREARIQLGTLPNPKTTREPLPSEIGWDEIASYLAAHQAAVELIRQGASRPTMGYVMSRAVAEADVPLWTSTGREAPQPSGLPGLLGVLIPSLSEAVPLGKVLGWDLLQAASDGDGERVASDAEAIMRLVKHVGETPLVINQLVAMAMTTRVVEQIGTILETAPQVLSDEQLQSLAHEVGDGCKRLTIARIGGEYMGFDDMVQNLYTDDGRGDGRLTNEGLEWFTSATSPGSDRLWWKELPGPVFATFLAGRRAMTERHAQIMRLMQRDWSTPLWQLEDMKSDEELDSMMESPVQRFRYFPVAVMTPALARVHVVEEQLIQERDGLLVAIALEIYHRRNGQWPEALGDLTPALLPSVPLDRFSGQAIGYRLINGQPVVYSIGVDRDDDGGVPPRDKDGQIAIHRAKNWRPAAAIDQMKRDAAPDFPDGDWVLWPKTQDPISWVPNDAPPPKVIHFAPP